MKNRCGGIEEESSKRNRRGAFRGRRPRVISLGQRDCAPLASGMTRLFFLLQMVKRVIGAKRSLKSMRFRS
ncbi:hypothetical protein P4O66_007708, partial [Electrophorus voltai]